MIIAVYAAALFVPLIFLTRATRKEIAGAAILIAFFMAANSGFIFGGVGPGWDTLAYSLGLHYVKGVLQSGWLPGWNPYFNCGEPLHIYHYSYDSFQWFLFVAFDYLLPAQPAALFKIYFASLFVFYNVGCYLFFRKLFDDTRVALFCFAVSLFSTAFVMYLNEHTSLYVSVYFPYLAYFFLEFAEKRRLAALFLIPALIGVAANVYLPHFVALALAVFAASWFVFARGAEFKLPEPKRAAVWLAAGCLLAVLAMLPVFYLYFKMPDFTTPMRFFFRGDIRILDLGDTGHHQALESLLTFITIPKSAKGRALLFVGVLPLALAVIGSLRSENRYRRAVLISAMMVFLISLGRNTLFFEVFQSLPLFNFLRHYVIFEVFVQFFVICLSGMGLEYLFRLPVKGRKSALILAAGVFAAVLIIFASITFLEMNMDGAKKPLMTVGLYSALFSVSAAAVFAALMWRSRAAYYLPIAAVVVSGGFLQWYFENVRMVDIRRGTLNAEVDATVDTERLDAILARKNDGHVWRPRRTEASRQRLTVDGYNTFEPALDGHEESFYEPAERSLLTSKRLYSMREMRETHKEYFGIGHPKMFTTESYKVLPDSSVLDAMKAGLGDFKSRGTVFVSAEESGEFFRASGAEPERGADTEKNLDDGVSVVEYNPDRVAVEVISDSATLLVYLQSFDKDWRVYVNGNEATLLRVNLNFQAVEIPKGASKVEFIYKPAYKGIFVAHLFATALVFGLMIFYLWKEPPIIRES